MESLSNRKKAMFILLLKKLIKKQNKGWQINLNRLK